MEQNGDVVLISETWRPSKEVWETEQGHVVIESVKFTNKHGVAIIVKQKVEKQDQMGRIRK